MWLGKIIGGLLGFAVGNVFGLLLGGFIGHLFDKSYRQFRPSLSDGERAQAEQLFFETVFQLMGFVAKADGRISKEEIAQAEHHMEHMRLRSDQRKQAIEYFKRGSEAAFDLERSTAGFNSLASKLPQLRQTVLSYVINMALADGRLDAEEEVALSQIAEQLGVSGFAFKHLLSMLRAQAQFEHDHSTGGQQGYHRPAAGKDELAMAYEALGVDDSVSDAVLKKSYRKLMSENHPDKLMGQGVPQEMIEMATERAKTIQSAYDLVKKHRKSVNQ